MSLIEPDGCTTAVTPDCTNLSIPSTKGKKASDAATILSSGLFIKIFPFFNGYLALSNLLGCPAPIPTVDLSFDRTIAFDLT